MFLTAVNTGVNQKTLISHYNILFLEPNRTVNDDSIDSVYTFVYNLLSKYKRTSAVCIFNDNYKFYSERVVIILLPSAST